MSERRNSLVALVLDRAVTLVEAPAGSGKSLLLDSLAAAIDATWLDHPEQLDHHDGDGWAVLDLSVGVPDDVLVPRLQRLRRRRPNAPVVVAGRWFGPRARAMAFQPGNLLLGPERLLVSVDELRQDLGLAGGVPTGGGRGGRAGGRQDDDPAAVIRRATGGWPLLINAVLASEAAGRRPEGVAPSVVRSLLGPAVAALDSADRRLVGLAGALPAVDAGLLEAAGGSEATLYRMIDVGLPLIRGSGGVYHLPPAVGSVLTVDHPVELPDDTLRQVAAELVRRGHGVSAVELAHRWGGTDEGAAVLASLDPDVIDGMEPDDLLGLLDLVGSATGRYPRLQLWSALAERGRANLDRQRHHLEEAAASAGGGGDAEAVRAEARAELLHLDALVGDRSDALADAIAAERAATGASERCRLLLVEAEALRLANGDTPDELEEAALQLSRAARGWAHLGQVNRSIATLRTLVVQALTPLGRYREADAAMAEAERLTGDRPRFAVRNLVVRNRNAALAGWAGLDQQLARGLELSTGLGNDWLQAYAHWSLMLYSAIDGGAVDVRTHHELAWSALGQLRDHPTGAIFLAESAAALARRGDVDRAAGIIARLQDRRSECAIELDLATLVVDARRLQPDEVARRAEQLLASGTVPAARRWRVLLEVAWARYHRAGECPGQLRDQVVTEAGLNGVGEVPARFYPELFAPHDEAEPATAGAQLLGVVGRAGTGGAGQSAVVPMAPAAPPPPRPSADTEAATISALGGFAVEVDGRERPISSSKARELLKLLTAMGGSASVDVVVDTLWPEVDTALGRRRLKNVVSRTRAEAGPIVVRDRGRVALRATVTTDVQRFDLAARHALLISRADPEVAIDACQAALSLYGGDLLPDDVDIARFVVARADLRSRAAALLDLMLSGTLGPLTPEMATAVADAALRIAPDDSVRLANLAGACLDLGARATARILIDRCRAIITELGVDPDPELAALEERLQAGISPVR